jgi:hypothetical protein
VPEHLRFLLARAFRLTLHRLRGLRALMGGWIEIGVPPGSEPRVRTLLEEDMQLLARLDWIGTLLAHAPVAQRLEAGEAPAVLLAAALGVGTPEEAHAALPLVQEPRAALALATWLQAKAPDAVLGRDAHLRWEGRSLVVELAAPRPAELGEWEAHYGELVTRREPHALVFRPGLFAARAEPDRVGAAG